MNEQFKNVVVHITSEEMLQQAREIIERNGHRAEAFRLSRNDFDYMYYGDKSNFFSLSAKFETDKEITLSEFEELFNEK